MFQPMLSAHKSEHLVTVLVLKTKLRKGGADQKAAPLAGLNSLTESLSRAAGNAESSFVTETAAATFNHHSQRLGSLSLRNPALRGGNEEQESEKSAHELGPSRFRDLLFFFFFSSVYIICDIPAVEIGVHPRK
jgi:hypothetical protein